MPGSIRVGEGACAAASEFEAEEQGSARGQPVGEGVDSLREFRDQSGF